MLGISEDPRGQLLSSLLSYIKYQKRATHYKTMAGAMQFSRGSGGRHPFMPVRSYPATDCALASLPWIHLEDTYLGTLYTCGLFRYVLPPRVVTL